MKLHPIITANAVLALAFAIAFIAAGPIMMAFFGLPELPGENILLYWNATSFGRMFGAGLFAFGLLLWALRAPLVEGALSPSQRRGVLFALLLANIVGAIVAVTQQMSVWSTAAGWVAVFLFALFTIAYGFLLSQE
jgi:hypothetical protein